MANIFYKDDLARRVKGENEVLMLNIYATEDVLSLSSADKENTAS